MNSKERLQAALNHRSPDRVCVDFGATAVTGMHVSCIEGLREQFGLEKRPVKVHEPYQMLGEIDDDLKEAIGIDTTGVISPKTMFGFSNDHWKLFRAPWGQEMLVPGQFNTTVDSNGDLLIYPEGDTTVPPSGRMPKTGFFFDSIIRQEPIEELKLNPQDNLEEFGPIADDDLDYFKREVEKASKTGRGVVATFGGTAFGDIALVPAPFLKHPRGIRDIAEWYMATAAREDYVHAVFSRQCEIAIGNLKKIYDVVGDAVDTVFICGTDFGTQTSQFCSAATFDSLYAPYYRKVNQWIHANTSWKTFKHSCGAIEPLMRRFIETGFDIINPVQCSAKGMDATTLKAEYGDQLTFWGGGVDTQKVLPFGTPQEVYEQVKRRIGIFGENGGFVFNAIHNVQANTPIDNITAMFKAIKDSNA